MGKKVNKRDVAARKAAARKGVAALKNMRASGVAGPMTWTDMLAQAGVDGDPRGDLANLAYKIRLVVRSGGLVEFLPAETPAKEVVAQPTREEGNMGPNKKTKRRNQTPRMPVVERAKMFWGLVGDHLCKSPKGELVSSKDAEVQGFAGFVNPASVQPFFSSLVATGVAEWKPDGHLLLVRDPHEMTAEDFHRPSGKVVVALPELVAVVGHDSDLEAELVAAEAAAVAATKMADEARLRATALGEQLQRQRKKMLADAKAAAKVVVAFGKLADAGEREAFFAAVLSDVSVQGECRKVLGMLTSKDS